METFLKQWTGRNGAPGAAQSPAKQHEFSVYVPPLMATLREIGASEIVDFQADEGVASVAFCAQSPAHHSTFVLIPSEGDPDAAMEGMARSITQEMRRAGQITLAVNASDIAPASADAILFSNILGCQGSVENIDAVLNETAPLVKAGGYAVVTAPNPDGGMFSTYACSNLPSGRGHGGTYDFLMKGEGDSFVNLYLTAGGLKDTFARHGFGLVKAQDIADKPYEGFKGAAPAFRQYLFRKAAP